ncbi:hypothetical protein ACFYYM_38010 [Streptomyces erythrochromogenes]|uniref:hypothetical protein n=1 Tax=Streptomyces erythrochromogenes TaxID=285574 RepID=UPI00367D933D
MAFSLAGFDEDAFGLLGVRGVTKGSEFDLLAEGTGVHGGGWGSAGQEVAL